MSFRTSRRRWRASSRKDIHFDLDDYLNQYIPPNPIKYFPKHLARFLGYRDEPAKELGNVLVSLWALLGAFVGLLVVSSVYKLSDLASYNPPVLFASLGATAILDYNTIQSPLAQPRAAIVGHGLSAVVGVGIAKLFMLSPEFESLRWLAGPVSCGVASFVMSMTNTVHPPGGATAVLAAVDPTTEAMGWMFVPFILLGSILMFFVACLVNNIQRQFPVFWWTPHEVGSWWRKPKSNSQDVESIAPVEETTEEEIEEKLGVRKMSHVMETSGFKQMIILTPEKVMLPEGFALDGESAQILQVLRRRLRQRQEGNHEQELEQESTKHVEAVTGSVSYGSETTHVDQPVEALSDGNMIPKRLQ